MQTISEIEPNLDLIQTDQKKIYLVGTAHVSKTSADLVELTIRKYHPDTVCVELCDSRAQALDNPDRWRETDIFVVLKEGKAYLLFAQLMLASFQKRIAKKLEIRPGEEMLRAITTARELGASLANVDRDIRVTLKRAWGKAGMWSLLKVIATLVASVFTDEELSETEIEELKSGDQLSALMTEFSEYLPGVTDVLISERDRYLASKIWEAEGSIIVAVVGAGHVPGIKQCIGSSIDRTELERIPPRNKALLGIAWGIPLAIIAMFIYGFFAADTETSLKMLAAWVLANGGLSALGALIALAHPLTILTAFVAAPITSLNPMIAAGWVCALVEAIVRKPRVKDLETIAEDISTVKGFWSNRVSKILLVLVLANLGSIIGTFVGGFKAFSFLP